MSSPAFLPFFLGASLLTASLTCKTWSSPSSSASPPGFSRFQLLYLGAYLCMVAGDWMQGPYVYALYDAYGFSQRDIAVLFVAGFGSSMVLGPIAGSLADKYGRKKFALLYVAAYVCSCLTKHVNSYWVLMLGRLLGGVSTSLLFSVFDSWMINEHNARGFDPSLLSGTFTKAVFANSVVAIASGLVANAAAAGAPLAPLAGGAWTSDDGKLMVGGATAPFDVAVLVLLCGGAAVANCWGENYGARSDDKGGEAGNLDAIKCGVQAVLRDEKILLTGLVTSLFEGSMYAFVFMWTPALKESAGAEELPFGLIFATFMVCCMAGSQTFGILTGFMEIREVATWTFALATASLAVPALTANPTGVFLAFLVFEFTVGLYFPAMGTLKSAIVPEKMRSTVYNIYRVPLNVIVLGVLLTSMSVSSTFFCCAAMLAAACFLQRRLSALIEADENKAKRTGVDSGAADPAQERQAMLANAEP